MRIREHLSYANVAATIALVLVIGSGGAAYAIAKNSVRSPHIVNGQVKTADVAKAAVSTAKIKTSAVTGVKVKDGSISGNDLANAAVSPSKIKNNAVTGSKVQNGSLSGSDLAARAVGVVQAGMNVTAAGDVDLWFNRLGGAPSVAIQPTTDHYLVTIPGAHPMFTHQGIAQVSSTDENVNCAWDATLGGGASMRIACRNAAGTAVFSGFHLTLYMS